MNISILGTGVMGSGIAAFLLPSSFVDNITVIGRSQQSLSKSICSIQASIDKKIKRKKLSVEDSEWLLRKINFTTELNALSSSDLIIEAIVENFENKKNILCKINPYITDKCIVASNTSSISLTNLSRFIDNPQNFLGIHFFNPVDKMNLIEVVSGFQTSQTTLDTTIHFLSKLSKKVVLVDDSPGFIVNRMLIPMINEAIFILSEGVSTKEDIDTAMKSGANHPMGPLELSDLIGNDVTLSIMDTLLRETGDSKYRAHPLLRKMVRAGALGRKTGLGFYNYNELKN